MKRKLLFTAALAISMFNANSQDVNTRRVRCYSTEHTDWRYTQDPSLRLQNENDEQQLQKLLLNSASSRSTSTNSIITIPVVVHVVYKTSGQNISTAQILSQIEVLNEDFAKMNADTVNIPAAFRPVASGTQIRFCMAKQDPLGAMTDGIERRLTTVTSFSTNDAVKRYTSGGLNAWDVNRYMNLWVCNMSGGILGYAEFPASAHTTTYGVVIQFDSFGRIGNVTPPYDQGRTLSHEIGHCFGLYHIWGDDGGTCSGSDGIADTPNQSSETYGCLSAPSFDACSGSTTNGIMFMNYMDYSDDNCLNMFTQNQATRMYTALHAYYPLLETSTACELVINNISSPNEFQFSVYPNPTEGILNINLFTASNFSEKVSVRITDVIGKVVAEKDVDQSSGQAHQIDLSNLDNGSYFVTVYNQSYKKTVQFVLSR